MKIDKWEQDRAESKPDETIEKIVDLAESAEHLGAWAAALRDVLRERDEKIEALEDQVAALEADCDALTDRIRDMETPVNT